MSFAHNLQHFTGKKGGKRIRSKSKDKKEREHINKYARTKFIKGRVRPCKKH